MFLFILFYFSFLFLLYRWISIQNGLFYNVWFIYTVYTLTGHFIRYTLLVSRVGPPFVFRTALILRGIDSTRCWNIRRCVHCSHKGWTWSATYSGSLWHLNNAQLVLRGPKYVKKISPTPLHHQHQQPEPLRQGRMDPCFSCSLRRIWPYYLNVATKSRLIRPGNVFPIFYCPIWWSCVNCSLRFLFLADRSGTRCGLLLLEPICFRVRRVMCSEMVFCILWL